MNDYIAEIIQRHKGKGVLLDANILLLYFVGAFNPEEISKFKRTRIFTVEDHYTLVRILGYFETIVTTPNILTEVSNLSGQLAGHLKGDYFEKFASGMTLFDEHYLSSANISEMQEFKRFGLTDAGIIHLARGSYLLVTDDFRLSQYLQKEGVNVLNFNHIRVFNWE